MVSIIGSWYVIRDYSFGGLFSRSKFSSKDVARPRTIGFVGFATIGRVSRLGQFVQSFVEIPTAVEAFLIAEK